VIAGRHVARGHVEDRSGRSANRSVAGRSRARSGRRVARRRRRPRARVRPRAVYRPRRAERRLDRTALHEHRGDPVEGADPAEQLVLLEPRVVTHVMSDQSRERERERGILETFGQTCDRRPRRCGRFPETPFIGRLPADLWVGIEQHAVVRIDDVTVSKFVRHRVQEPLPLLGEEGADAAAEQPVDLGAPRRVHAPQDHAGHAVRMPLAVCEPERAPPRASGHEPTVHTESARAAVRCLRSGSASCCSDRSMSGSLA
jgi:hypothetical protein